MIHISSSPGFTLQRFFFDCTPFIPLYSQLCLPVLHSNFLVVSVSREASQEYAAPPKDTSHRWAFRSRRAGDFRKWQLNLSFHFKSNDAAAFQYHSREISYQTCDILLLEVCVNDGARARRHRFKVLEESHRNFTRVSTAVARQFGVSHSSCVASLLPAAVAG